MSSLHTHIGPPSKDKEGKKEDAEDKGTFKRCALTASFLPPINTSSINTPRASTQNHRSARHMTGMSFTSRTPQWLMQYVSSAVFIEPCGFYCYKMVPIDKK